MTELPGAWTDDERAAGQQTAGTWRGFFQGTPQAPLAQAQAIEETARVTEAKDRHSSALLRRENVVGVAASLKVTGGQPTGQRSLTVFVERKLPLAEVPEESRVPEQVDGVPTDVVQVGRIVPPSTPWGCCSPARRRSRSTITSPTSRPPWVCGRSPRRGRADRLHPSSSA